MAAACQLHLPLALGKTLFAGFGKPIKTMRAADLVLVCGIGFVGFCDGVSSGVALVVLAFFKLMVDRDAFIEHKTLAFP